MASHSCHTGQQFPCRGGRRCSPPLAIRPPPPPPPPSPPQLLPPRRCRQILRRRSAPPQARRPTHLVVVVLVVLSASAAANAAGALSGCSVRCDAPDEGHHRAPGKHAHPPPPSPPDHLAVNPDQSVCDAIVIVGPCRPRLLQHQHRLHCWAIAGGGGLPRTRDIVDDDAIDDIVVGDAAPMPQKNGIRPSTDRTRSRMDDRNDDGDDDGDDNGNRVGRREDRRQRLSPSPSSSLPSSSQLLSPNRRQCRMQRQLLLR